MVAEKLDIPFDRQFLTEVNIGPDASFALVDGARLADAQSLDKAFLERHLLGEEQATYLGFQYPKRRAEWLAGRLAAKYAAILHGRTMGHPTDFLDCQVMNQASGKPMLVPAGQDSGIIMVPEISISHSHGLAVAMASETDCGIDLQEITETVVRVREKFADPAEVGILANLQASGCADQKTSLTLLWSAKEALRKKHATHPLPGFLEIVLSDAQVLDGGLRLNFMVNNNQRKICGVLVFMHGRHACAFC